MPNSVSGKGDTEWNQFMIAGVCDVGIVVACLTNVMVGTAITAMPAHIHDRVTTLSAQRGRIHLAYGCCKWYSTIILECLALLSVSNW